MTKNKKEEEQKRGKIPNYAKFIISGLAGCGAVVFCQPIDVIKNRMQLSGEGGKTRDHKTAVHAFFNIWKNEGPLALYDGFSANIARQICYTMTRLGVYQMAIEKFAERGVEGFKAQIGSSLIAGFIASSIATPTDVALVRMTADRRLPDNEQRKYKHVIDALIRMTREEGITTLWTGVTPTVLRAMLGNVTQLTSYVQAKHYILRNDILKWFENTKFVPVQKRCAQINETVPSNQICRIPTDLKFLYSRRYYLLLANATSLITRKYMRDGIGCHFISSLISGFVYAFSTAPIDMAKTRVQTMKKDGGVGEYSSMFDVWVKTFKKEGVTALWKGFGPYYFRIAPNTVLLFVFAEKLTFYYKKYILGDVESKGGF